MKFDYFWDTRIGPVLVVSIQNHDYGLCLCHRMPERSIRFFGLENYFCARCLGMLLGGILGFALNQFDFNLPPVFAFLFIIPLVFDGFSQALKLRESTNELRLITGFLFGIGMLSVLHFFWITAKNLSF